MSILPAVVERRPTLHVLDSRDPRNPTFESLSRVGPLPELCCVIEDAGRGLAVFVADAADYFALRAKARAVAEGIRFAAAVLAGFVRKHQPFAEGVLGGVVANYLVELLEKLRGLLPLILWTLPLLFPEGAGWVHRLRNGSVVGPRPATAV